MKPCICLLALILVSCGKEEAQPELKRGGAPPSASTSSKPAVPEKKLPPVPQGKLPQMAPEKAKFIAVPSTPKDPADKTADKSMADAKKTASPAAEVKPAQAPVLEVKKATPPATTAKPNETAAPEVQKEAPAVEVKKPASPASGSQ